MTRTETSPVLIIAAWLLVLTPLVWGVIRTLINVAALF
jgi:hypothetical protein